MENKASIKPAHSHINQRDVKETGARPASRFYKWAERRASVDNETKERKGNNVGCKVQCARAGRKMRFFLYEGNAKAVGKSREKGGRYLLDCRDLYVRPNFRLFITN